MNINRHNYEEFFLLYVDNELSATEKATVDTFVNEHPDLKAELNALKETVLPNEDFVFDNKELLFKNEAEAINTNNCEEKFLLYVDNELTESEKQEVETFVLQHPKLQNDFTLLQQTKLESEIIICPDKESLYRKEEKRVVYFNWQRLAVAAVLTGLAILIWTIIPSEKNNIENGAQGFASNSEAQTKGNNNSGNNDSPVITEPSSTELVAATKEKRQNNLNTRIVKNGIEETSPSIPEKENPEYAINNDKPKNNIVEIVDGPAPVNSVATKNAPDHVHATPAVNNSDDNNSLMKQTVYRELQTDEDDNSVYIGNIELNKDKVRGLIKKAGRIFAKPKNNEDPKVAFASFPINGK